MDTHNSRVALGVGLGLAATGTALWLWRNRSAPEVWEEVGKVDDLMLFPLKSAKGIRVKSGTVHPFGLESGGVIDRSFIIMMTSANPWIHVTNGMVGILNTILPSLKDGFLTLTSTSEDFVKVNIQDILQTGTATDFTIRGDKLSGLDCGDAVANWLQKELYSKQPEDTRPTLRLMFVGNPQSMIRSANKPPYFDFNQFRKTDLILYQDTAAVLITNTASLEDLNSRVKEKVEMMQVRPNIVVSTAKPFDEDNWAYLRVGDELELRAVKPREACHRIQVRPDNGEKNTEMLDVLKEYRVPPLQKPLAEKWSKSPLFGLNMALDSDPATINVGDKVWALRKKPNWLL